MAVNPIPRQLERLTRLAPDSHPVLSCYLKIEPRDRARGKYLIKFKNRARRLREELPQLGLSRENERTVLSDLERIQTVLGDPANLPSSQGVAIFASGGRRLFEVLPLPRVHRSRLGVDRTPLLRELAALEDEIGRILTVVIDRNEATLFEVTAFGAKAVETITATTTRTGRGKSRQSLHGGRQGTIHGVGDGAYQNRIHQDRQRHFEQVAARLFAVDRAAPAHAIVLAGSGPEAKGLEPFLHAYLMDRYIGHVALDAKDHSPSAIYGATLAIREAHERAAERDLVHDMEEGLATRWAVQGIPATLRALNRGQVRTLLVQGDTAQPGYCNGEGQLAVAEADLRGSREIHRVLDVVDDAIEEALRQRVQVNVVYDRVAAAAIDGLAGMLRFR